ncbi:MAG: PD-(D/E)XK nuclease family protein [Helicobacter sp.]|nr:PD-(D/E)XK nuclease family protein [Helicobacter sp.]
MSDLVNKETLLEELLLDEDYYPHIKNRQIKCIYALQLQNQEIRHSSFLAWLLNPNESHKLGDAFLKELLQIVLKEYSKNPEITIKLFDIILNNFNDAKVEREKRTDEGRRIDIFIESESNDFVCVIENKVWTKDTNNQLEHYQAYIDSKNYKHKLFIYLAPNPRNDYGKLYKNYMCLSYKKVCQAIDNLFKRQTNAMCDKIRYFIEDYKEMVERNIMGSMDNEILGLCLKIYNKHKEAIEAINKAIKDYNGRISGILQEIINENNSLALETCKDEWVAFISKKVDGDYDSLKISKADEWIKSDTILTADFQIKMDNIKACFAIRDPKDDNANKQRKKLLTLAEELGYNDLDEYEGYYYIYSVPLFDKKDEYFESLRKSDSELKEILKKKLEESKIIKTYEDFADKANRLITNN